MYAVCLRYTRNQTDAEDCLQDAFVKVFTRISDFRHEGVFEGWVRRIVVNTVIEQFRRKTPIHQFDSIDHLPESPYDIDYDHDTAGLNAEFLMRLVQEMPQQYQIVFSLYAIDGYSHDEIAQQLGISLGTSKSNLSRRRKWLQKRLAQIENIDNKTFAANASDR